ncbi:MAG: hypothetical protein HQL51_08920 [Magnetococcales bacterium]|nr:hypothetical protein [Magnetococcales bacterium]
MTTIPPGSGFPRWRRLPAALLLLLASSGCASYVWHHPDKELSALPTESYACEQEAARLYPAAFVNQFEPGVQGPVRTQCQTHAANGTTTCVSLPGASIPPRSEIIDANYYNRNHAFSSCMNARGWRLIPQNGL